MELMNLHSGVNSKPIAKVIIGMCVDSWVCERQKPTGSRLMKLKTSLEGKKYCVVVKVTFWNQRSTTRHVWEDSRQTQLCSCGEG